MLPEGARIGIGVLACESGAAAGEHSADDRQVFDFIARDGGHRHHPVLGRRGDGVSIHQFQGIRRGFLLEMGVIVQQFQRLIQNRRRPRNRREILQWQIV